MEPVGDGQSEKRRVLSRTEERWIYPVKIPWLIVGVFLTLSATSQAGPHGGGFRGGFSGGAFRGGFSGGGFHGRFSGGGFHGGFSARRADQAFRMGHGIHCDFANRRFFCQDQLIVFQQFAWPVYWYPYNDPLAYSYLKPEPDYQYWDNSAAFVQPPSSMGAIDRAAGPLFIQVTATRRARSTSGSC